MGHGNKVKPQATLTFHPGRPPIFDPTPPDKPLPRNNSLKGKGTALSSAIPTACVQYYLPGKAFQVMLC